jgi:predicted metal-dependent hydrolase
MGLDWSEGPLAEGLRCYCACEFFEAHEHWESAWLACQEPEKTFLQALIQITAAFHHLHGENRVGAASLLRAALRRLEPCPAEYGGVRVAELRESVRAWIDAIEQGDADLDYPRIR